MKLSEQEYETFIYSGQGPQLTEVEVWQWKTELETGVQSTDEKKLTDPAKQKTNQERDESSIDLAEDLIVDLSR